MSVWIHETALILGKVRIGNFSSVLPYAVLRGDLSSIEVGCYTNIQDHCMVHNDMGYSAKVGNFVTVGHGVVLHGCMIEDCCIVGMKSVIMNGSRVGAGSIVGAGTVIKEGMVIPPRSLVIGNPAVVKENRYTSFNHMIESALIYFFLTRFYLKGQLPNDSEIERIYRYSSVLAQDLDKKISGGMPIENLVKDEYQLLD